MSTAGLAPAGSSTYNSATMYVGDGTWDSQRNTFLLPNLVGLNFATMRYNGMGNRFLEQPGYHGLIRAHGIIAAITFLAIVPVAIMIKRFYTRTRVATRYHIWLQILTVLLTTAIFVLAYLAVGRPRSFTNPHHGIGLAIYIIVLVQFIGGWWVHEREKNRQQIYVPLRGVFHYWLGRVVGLLGLAQIPLGLTLYGSPKALFILYALAAFALVAIYFILDYLREKRLGRELDSEISYASGSGGVADNRRHGRFGTLAEGAVAGAGLSALANRFRNRRREEVAPEVVGSRRNSGSLIEEEKFYHEGRDRNRWRNRLLGVGTGAGATALAAKLFRSRRDREDDSDIDQYERRSSRVRPPPAPGRETEMTEDSLAIAEEGRTRPTRQHPLTQVQTQPLTQTLSHHRSHSSLSDASYMSGPPADSRGHGLRDAVAGLGALGLARNFMEKRRKRKEDRRVEAIRQQEIEDERLNRRNSRRYTGDGFPRRNGRRGSLTTSTDYSAADELPRRNAGIPPPVHPAVPPAVNPALAAAAGGIAGAALADRQHERNRTRTNLAASNPDFAVVPPTEQNLEPPLAPVPPVGSVHHDSSGSEMYASAGGRRQRRHSMRNTEEAAAAAAAGGAAGILAGEALASHRDESRRRQASVGEGSMASPPVSVKVKMHSDGRHVTLRRVPEQERAAERAARRQSRSSHSRRRRGTSASDLSGAEVGRDERWRRTENIERQQAAEMDREREAQAQAQAQAYQAQAYQAQASAQAQPQTAYLPPPPPVHQQQPPQILNPNNLPLPSHIPPPPPIPATSPAGPTRPGTANLSSPGTIDGTEASDYANNRRRRRAQRARADGAGSAAGMRAGEFT